MLKSEEPDLCEVMQFEKDIQVKYMSVGSAASKLCKNIIIINIIIKLFDVHI